jgi:glycosyltransferase involved in cell wall biosynthesis
MKSLVFYIGGFAPTGGIETFTSDLLRSLRGTDFDLQLVVWGLGTSGNALLQAIEGDYVTVRRSFWRWGCRWNVPDYVLLPLGIFAACGADMLVFKRPPPRLVMSVLRTVARKAVFVMITPYRPREYWTDPTRPTGLQYFDAVVVQSDEAVQDLRLLGFQGRIESIPLIPSVPLPLSPLPSTRCRRHLRIGFLGRLEPQKNLSYLLQVFGVVTELAAGEFTLELHLFGDGTEKDKLINFSRELFLKDCHFHGTIPRERINEVIDSCDLFLNTSLTEGQCVAALEILGRGRPLVATPVGSLPEVLFAAVLGRIGPLNDAHRFADSVMAVLRMIHCGDVTADKVAASFRNAFSHRAIVDRYLELFGQLLRVSPSTVRS